MQPQTPTPEANLNLPQVERLPTPITPEATPATTPEVAPAPQETQSRPAGDGTNQNAGMPVMPMPQPQVQPARQLQTQVVDDTPPVAGDVDLIEKEWVNKAKEVVARTKEDPHKQNDELNNVKVGYMKKRYNREVKLPENGA